MGANMCCIQLETDDEDFPDIDEEPYFMGRILNTSILEGDDFIVFYDADFKPIVSSSIPFKITFCN